MPCQHVTEETHAFMHLQAADPPAAPATAPAIAATGTDVEDGTDASGGPMGKGGGGCPPGGTGGAWGEVGVAALGDTPHVKEPPADREKNGKLAFTDTGVLSR